MDSKKWWQSKTVWANAAAIVAAGAAYFAGGVDFNTAVVPAVMGLVNLILRIATKQPLDV